MSTEPDHTDRHVHERDYGLERLIMLSDGVFAIAMTLMALDVRPPEHWDHTVPGLLDALAVPFQAFFWSFFATGVFWASHRRLFGRYTRADAPITVINLLLLGQITLIPVATRLLTELGQTPSALWLYLSLYGLIGLTNAASFLYACAAGIVRPRPGPASVACIGVTLATVPAGMTGLGVFSILPGCHWLPALMPPVLALLAYARRVAEAYDGRHAAAALLAPEAADKVKPNPA
jgi:uncharacterized membrane protein